MSYFNALPLMYDNCIAPVLQRVFVVEPRNLLKSGEGLLEQIVKITIRDV